MENKIELNIRKFDEFVVTKGHYGTHLFSAGNDYTKVMNYCKNISMDNPTKTIEVTDETIYGTVIIINGTVSSIVSQHRVNIEYLEKQWLTTENAMVS